MVKDQLDESVLDVTSSVRTNQTVSSVTAADKVPESHIENARYSLPTNMCSTYDTYEAETDTRRHSRLVKFHLVLTCALPTLHHFIILLLLISGRNLRKAVT